MDTFVSQRSFIASAHQLFNAIEDPELLARWWGPEGFQCNFKSFNFTKNGEWIFDMIGPGNEIYPNRSKFLEIQKPNKVIIRHEEAPLFTVTLTIKEEDNRATLVFSQKFDDPDVLEKILHIITPANEQLFNKLEKLL